MIAGNNAMTMQKASSAAERVTRRARNVSAMDIKTRVMRQFFKRLPPPVECKNRLHRSEGGFGPKVSNYLELKILKMLSNGSSSAGAAVSAAGAAAGAAGAVGAAGAAGAAGAVVLAAVAAAV